MTTAAPAFGPGPVRSIVFSWEAGVVAFMAALYLVGVWLNPPFFGDGSAVSSILRDAARFGIMAVGMSFVIVQKDLDLSVGSTQGLVACVFAICFTPTYNNFSAELSVAIALAVGLSIGLANGILVTWLRVPAFIATLTMLFIGRGLVLALTGSRNIDFKSKAGQTGEWFFALGGNNVLGFNNQILVFLVVAVIGALILARTRWGYETYAVGGNLQAAAYAGINTDRVRIRGFVLSSLCATIAGLLNMAQDQKVDGLTGFGAELIVIAAVIVGGASILGGRGRVAGSCLGAILIVLIDRVLRQGYATTTTRMVGDTELTMNTFVQLPEGAVPAFLGLILIIAVLIEPWVIRQKLFARIGALLRGRPQPQVQAVDSVAIVGAKTHGTVLDASAIGTSRIARLLARREAAAVLFVIALWLLGFWLRPDFWGNLDNSFNLLLAFTEIGILAVGMTYVIATGDIDLSVGAVLALSAGTASYLMAVAGVEPLFAVGAAMGAGLLAGAINGFLTTVARLPAFVATLGMFYAARGVAAWLSAGRQLSGLPEDYTRLGRKFIENLQAWGIAPPRDSLLWNIASAMSTQTLILGILAVIAAIVLGWTGFGYRIYATGGNRRAAEYAGISTMRVRFTAMLFSAFCASLAGIIYAAYLRSYNPSAGLLRELDAIAAVIIGGASIAGGYGTILGALAGAAVITLIRAVLTLPVDPAGGAQTLLPPQMVGLCIGLVLIIAVLADIWLRQTGVGARLAARLFGRRRPAAPRTAGSSA